MEFHKLKKMSLVSNRGRYHLTEPIKKLINFAIGGVGSWMLCSDVKNATYEKVRIRELIREHYPNKQSILKVSVVGNTIFVWNKKLYNANTINEKIFNKIFSYGKMTLSSKYEQNEREKDLLKLGELK